MFERPGAPVVDTEDLENYFLCLVSCAQCWTTRCSPRRPQRYRLRCHSRNDHKRISLHVFGVACSRPPAHPIQADHASDYQRCPPQTRIMVTDSSGDREYSGASSRIESRVCYNNYRRCTSGLFCTFSTLQHPLFNGQHNGHNSKHGARYTAY